MPSKVCFSFQLAFLLLPCCCFSQKKISEKLFYPEERWQLGFQQGFGSCKITGIGETIIRNEYYNDSQYDIYEHRRIVGFTYLYVGYSPYNWPIFMDLGVQFTYPTAFSGGKSHKWDFNYTGNDITYDIAFNYGYLNMLFVLSCPIKLDGKDGRYYISPKAGIKPSIMTGKKNILYRSDDPKPGHDLEIRDNLRSVLAGKSYFCFTFGGELGACFLDDKLRIYLNYMWDTPGSDAIETLPNNYNFTDNRNTRRSWQLGAGIQYTL